MEQQLLLASIVSNWICARKFSAGGLFFLFDSGNALEQGVFSSAWLSLGCLVYLGVYVWEISCCCCQSVGQNERIDVKSGFRLFDLLALRSTLKRENLLENGLA